MDITQTHKQTHTIIDFKSEFEDNNSHQISIFPVSQLLNQSWTIKFLSIPLLVQLPVWSPKNLQYLTIIPNNFRYFREYSLM